MMEGAAIGVVKLYHHQMDIIVFVYK